MSYNNASVRTRTLIAIVLLVLIFSSLLSQKTLYVRAQEEADEIQRISRLFTFVTKGIRELEPGGWIEIGGQMAWGTNGLLYWRPSHMQPMEPSLDINLYAAEVLEFMLENKDLIGLAEKDISLAEERIASICSYVLFGVGRSRYPPGGWPPPGGGADMSTELTSIAIRVVLKALELGIISASGPEHQELSIAISALLKTQNKDGGWGLRPESVEGYEKRSDPYYTAMVLETLLLAEKAGFKDKAIKKAIAFLQSSAIKRASKAHWSTVNPHKEPSDAVVTAKVLEALIAAHANGYEVEIELIKQALRYENEYLNTALAQGLFREASYAIKSLCYASALGLIDTSDVINRGTMLIEQLKESQTEEGYWSTYPTGADAPQNILTFSHQVSSLLLEWFWITSLDIDLDYEGPLMEYEPPRLVENDTMSVKLKLSNLAAGTTLNLRVSVTLPQGCQLLEEKGSEISLPPGESAVYEAVIKAPEKVENLTPATMAFIISKDPGVPIRSRLLELELARNAEIKILSKEVTPDELYLGEEALMTVALKNVGEVPALTVAIAEELGEGFLVLTEGSPNATVASMIAVGRGFPVARVEPGETVKYSITIKADSPAGGNVLISTTRITYLDPLGKVREIQLSSNVTVKRPELKIELNSSDFEMKWHQSRVLSVKVMNRGNSIAKDVSITIRSDPELSLILLSKPEGSEATYEREANRQRISLGEIAPNETIEVVLSVKSSWFYPSTSKLVSFQVSVDYKDERNKFFEDFRDAEAIQVNLQISNLAKGIFAIFVGILLTIAVLRIRASMASRPKRRFKSRRARRFG